METRTYQVFKYDELTQEGKEKARERFREGNGYPWFRECEDSLQGFKRALPIKIDDYEYGERGRAFIRFTVTDDNLLELKGLRLRTWLINNFWNKLEKGKFIYQGGISADTKSRYSKLTKEVCCPFTGYCADESLLDPIRDFLKSPDKSLTFEELIKDCFYSFARSVADDIDYQNSDEAIEETIRANDYDFTGDGKLD
jgi:hypothetical protein